MLTYHMPDPKIKDKKEKKVIKKPQKPVNKETTK
jgi:hypothetical protein